MEKQFIDDAFCVELKQWGTWDSYDKNGKCIVTSLTEESCINATRFYLKQTQEFNNITEKTYSGEVSGKL